MLGSQVQAPRALKVGKLSSNGALSLPVRCNRQRSLTIVAANNFGNFFKGNQGGGGGKDADAARKALQDAFGGKEKKYENFFGKEKQPPAQTEGSGGDKGGFGGFGGSGGSGGGGGGGGGFGFGDADGGNKGPERTISAEILEALRYCWTVFWNLALFLAFADVLHRSLDWCCSIELLFLVGAGQQATERLAGVFFGMIESFEKNVLGWDIPGDDDMIPMYENIKMFYPRAHAYTFDQYRYNVDAKDKEKLIDYYALRHYEREGGQAGDVDAADINAIKAKYEPLEADRKAYQAAKANNRLEDYWAAKKGTYESVTGQRYVRPPGASPPLAPA